MQKPFFSVVIPTLDEEKTLPKLLEDLLGQTYFFFEVIVVDGGSKDRTVQCAQDFSQKNAQFSVVSCIEKNVSIQRNHGAKQSHGEYLVFIDADTRIPSYYLEGLHYNLMKERVDGFTTCATSDSSSSEARMIIQVLNLGLEGGAQLGIPYAVGSSLGVSKKVFDAIGGFDPAIRFMEDTELSRRLHKNGYSFTTYKDPTFVMNMRRYRKEGTLTLTVKMIPVFLNSLLTDKVVSIDHIYPMLGGSYYKKNKSQTLVEIRELQNMLKKIVRSRSKRAQEIVKKLRDAVGV